MCERRDEAAETTEGSSRGSSSNESSSSSSEMASFLLPYCASAMAWNVSAQPIGSPEAPFTVAMCSSNASLMDSAHVNGQVTESSGWLGMSRGSTVPLTKHWQALGFPTMCPSGVVVRRLFRHSPMEAMQGSASTPHASLRSVVSSALACMPRAARTAVASSLKPPSSSSAVGAVTISEVDCSLLVLFMTCLEGASMSVVGLVAVYTTAAAAARQSTATEAAMRAVRRDLRGAAGALSGIVPY
mmetsp:Transcript_19911/g.45854  ORF Transcript_19911/g.45854 Transcript_19911/m.45854 type:complete len:243 (-) Transcript_19911:55-783(-)